MLQIWSVSCLWQGLSFQFSLHFSYIAHLYIDNTATSWKCSGERKEVLETGHDATGAFWNQAEGRSCSGSWDKDARLDISAKLAEMKLLAILMLKLPSTGFRINSTLRCKGWFTSLSYYFRLSENSQSAQLVQVLNVFGTATKLLENIFLKTMKA